MTTHARPLGPCEARGCTQVAAQTAKPRGAISVVELCDLDALYMVDLPLYQAPGVGRWRTEVVVGAPLPAENLTALTDRITRALALARTA